MASQAMITGIAKKDRKKTASPGGTWLAVALIKDAMTIKVTTEQSLKKMPRIGRMF
jgi:hypothetical protein